MSGQNPYAPPKADVSVDPRLDMQDLPTAGMGARFLNFIIDNIIARVVFAQITLALAAAVGVGDGNAIIIVIISLGGFVAYYVIQEAAFGWTIGKLITGTRVVRFDGTPARVPQIIGRTLARFIPFEPFSLLFGSSNQGWHDSLSGTRVVRVRR
jgi:uncharacterized RDD family membrane protein YckC